MNAPFSPAELKARIPVWQALSEFWLDTSLQAYEFDYMARALAASPFSLDEIRKIHLYEVVPAVSANLFSIAGEWGSFDEEWLVERCQKYAARRSSRLFRARMILQAPGVWFMVFLGWRQVARRIQVLRRRAARGEPPPAP